MSSSVINTRFSDDMQTETIRLVEKLYRQVESLLDGHELPESEHSVPESHPEVETRRGPCNWSQRYGYADAAPEEFSPDVEVFSPLILILLWILVCINVYLMTLPSQIPQDRSPRVYVTPVQTYDVYMKFSYSM